MVMDAALHLMWIGRQGRSAIRLPVDSTGKRRHGERKPPPVGGPGRGLNQESASVVNRKRLGSNLTTGFARDNSGITRIKKYPASERAGVPMQGQELDGVSQD
jgi:hypothetical protein